MLEILFWIAVGCVIGWHVPPTWVKVAQDFMVGWFRKLVNK